MVASDSSSDGTKTDASKADDRAAAYRLLAWFLLAKPDESFIREMLAGGPDSWSTCNDPSLASMRDGLLEIRDFLVGRQADDPEKLCLELAVQWTRLFRGVAPGYGPRPPYEAIYRRKDAGAQAELLLDLGNLYRVAGVAISVDRIERPDHLGLELDLMGLLCSEESGFWSQGNSEEAAGRRGLQRRLLQEHLLPWVPAYCEVILREPGVPFYHGVMRALSALLDEDAGSFGLASKTAPTRRGL